MSGSFSSLNTALSALRYQQTALDVASTNIANASTDGYVRRRALGQTVGAAAAPALWSRSNEVGSGVQSSGVERMVDPLIDTRVRREHARQSFLDTKADALTRVEGGIAEPGDSGVSAALIDFRKALHDLVNAPGSDAARSQVVSSAAVVADSFNIQARNVSDEAGDQRARALESQQQVNDLATQLAATNKIIATAKANGTDTSTLMDSRDQMALKLAELTGATATQRSDGGMDVAIGGVSLVKGSTAGSLEITAGIDSSGAADGSPVAFTVHPADGTADTVVSVEGSLGASAELLNVTLPNYLAQLDGIAQSFASDLNAAQMGGQDANGNAPAKALFTGNSAATIQVTVGFTLRDVAAADPLVGGSDSSNADKMADAITVDDDYQRLVNGFGSDVASVKRLSDNQRAMSTQIDASREQLAGVSIDEETVNMVMAQHSYEAAARVMTTVDEMLDTLINRTGMVGR
ncbi:flagellar hook-associated protein FlgK [Nocardioides sp. CN2-186]|uniref:flagellar hook-associated protein FlgK n=1 Tax=Nocardioides tweenelious TaxID=3156607 RepID=UPI0032B54DE1